MMTQNCRLSLRKLSVECRLPALTIDAWKLAINLSDHNTRTASDGGGGGVIIIRPTLHHRDETQ